MKLMLLVCAPLLLALLAVAGCDFVASGQIPEPRQYAAITYPKTAYERMIDARLAASESCVQRGGVPLFDRGDELKECRFPPASRIHNTYSGAVGMGTNMPMWMGTGGYYPR